MGTGKLEELHDKIDERMCSSCRKMHLNDRMLELINSEVLSALGELEEEYEKDVNSEWFSPSGGQVDLVSFAQSIKNRYKL